MSDADTLALYSIILGVNADTLTYIDEQHTSAFDAAYFTAHQSVLPTATSRPSRVDATCDETFTTFTRKRRGRYC